MQDSEDFPVLDLSPEKIYEVHSPQWNLTLTGLINPGINFIVENLVHLARSEAVGYAVKSAAKNTEFRRQNSE